MSSTVKSQKNLIIFGIPLLIIGVLVLIARSPAFTNSPHNLANGITFDLLLTVPFVYFLLIRKTKIPFATVVPFVIFGMIICSLVLPSENQRYLNLFKTWVLPVVEISVLSYMIFNVRKAIKDYRSNKTESLDFFTILKKTCNKILPKGFVIPVITEIAVFYYGFIYWKKRELKENEFSYHKNSGSVALLCALLFIITIETFALHILLEKWSNTAAWVLTALSVYSGIQIFGFIKSMLKRPISIENDQLFLRYGIMTETTIDLKDIDRVEISSKDIELNKETRKLSFLGTLESHNVIIHLKKENELTGFYGVRKNYRNLALHVDDNLEFKNRILNAIQRQ